MDDKNDTLKAKVDGREVDVEIVGAGAGPSASDFASGQKNTDNVGARPAYRQGRWRAVPLHFSGWKATLFLLAALVIFIGIIALAVKFFIWALPVLVPLFIILLVFRLFRSV